MTYKYQSPFGSTYNLQISHGAYLQGPPAIKLIDADDGMPYATATVYVGGLRKDEVAIKNYSENEGVLDFLLENNIIHQPHRFIESGYVTLPICKLK